MAKYSKKVKRERKGILFAVRRKMSANEGRKNGETKSAKITKSGFGRGRNGENGIILCVDAKFIDKNSRSIYTEPVYKACQTEGIPDKR